MPVYSYTARTRDGKKVAGTIEGANRRAVLDDIERRGQIPVSVTEGAAASAQQRSGDRKQRFTWRRKDKMGSRDVLLFTTELSDLLASGMTLGNALNSLANRRSGTAGDTIIAGLRDEIVRGASLSEAAEQYPDSFSPLYASMLRAGEASGALDEVLRRLVEHYERIQEVKEQVTMALVYPLIVMVLGAATLVFSMIYVVPKFEQVFAQLNQALPLPTRILIGTSTFMARYGWLLLIGLVIGIVLLQRFVKTRQGKHWWDGLQLKTPLIRGVVAAGIFANFARTLATLMSNGVPVLQALGIVERTVGNSIISDELAKARERVTDGTTISGPLAASRVFPPIMTDMLAVGEQTGDMVGALGHIARRYENELDRHVKIFTTALEPILIVVVAVLVGFVAISILMAVFNLTNGLNA